MTTEIELHVYITSEDDGRHVAVYDASIPYHRPEVDDLWSDMGDGRPRRPAPLAGRVYVDHSATGQDIAVEVAYLAMTSWPHPVDDWRKIVFRRGYAGGSSETRSVIASALADLHRSQEYAVPGPLGPDIFERNIRIDIAAACSSAEARCDLELQLERAACLTDEAAVAWLDGDRSVMPMLLDLADRARVRSFGVYADDVELLDTIIVRPPPTETPPPVNDLTAIRWETARGRQAPELAEWCRRDLYLADHGPWPGGHSLSVMDTAVRRGLAEWVDHGRHSKARVLPCARGFVPASTAEMKIADLLSRADDRGFICRPRRDAGPHRSPFGHKYQHGEVTVFYSASRFEDVGPSSNHMM